MQRLPDYCGSVNVDLYVQYYTMCSTYCCWLDDGFCLYKILYQLVHITVDNPPLCPSRHFIPAAAEHPRSLSWHHTWHHLPSTFCAMSRYPSIFGGDSQSLINPGIEPSNSSSFAAAYVHHKPTRSGNTPHTGLRNKPAPWSHSFPTATSFGQTGTLASVPPLHHNPRSRSIMQLPFQMHNGRRVTLNIMLPPGFPKERPVLSVGEPLVHPWIGFGGQLDFPSLRSWAPTSSLVKVVQDAYQGLGGRPQSPRAAPPAPATSTGTFRCRSEHHSAYIPTCRRRHRRPTSAATTTGDQCGGVPRLCLAAG